MGSIKDRVAIVGMGCTKFGELWDKSADDLIIDAAYEAYEDAGIEPKDIQAVWMGTAGSGEIGVSVATPLKLKFKPVTRVENRCASGIEAVRAASYAVAAGIYDIALAIGFEKMGEMGSLGLHLERAFAPFSPHPVMEMGLNPPALFSFSAIRYFQRYGLSIEEGKRILAMIAVKNHHNGTLCPKAHLRREVTIEQVLNAPIIAWPFGLFDCCGNSDGGAAAIICRADMAKKFRPDPIFIKGLGISVNYGEPFLSPDFDTTHFEETVTAANQAYQEAGIKNPRQEISLAIVHDCFTATELITYEDLGFSPRGRAKEDVEAGTFTLEGSLPVNSDGGLKSFGHPTGATGLRMMYEIYKQIQGKAQLPARQLKNPQIGLVHNLGRSNSGTAYGGSVVGVAILGA